MMPGRIFGVAIAILLIPPIVAINSEASAQGTFIKPEPPPEVKPSSLHLKKRKPLVRARLVHAIVAPRELPSKPLTVRVNTYPDIPDVEDRIDGLLQDVIDGATIIVNNHTVRLSALTPLHVEGFAARMLAYVGHAQLVCTRENIDSDPQRNFNCMADGKDLALVSLINGGSDTPDTASFATVRKYRKYREHLTSGNSDPAVASFLAGTFTTDCTNIDCGAEFFSREYLDDFNLWSRNQYDPLLRNLLKNGDKLDFYYYLLGSTANHFGSYKAAQQYLGVAQHLMESGSASERCIVALYGICRSGKLGDLISHEKKHADYNAAFEF